MKKLVCYLSCMLLFYTTAAQFELDLKDYDFKEIPTLTAEEDARYEKEGAVVLYYNRVLDYRYDGEQIELWECLHYTVKAYTSKGLESYHKFYLPEVENEDIIACKARYLNKEGKMTYLTKSDIVEREIDEEKEKYLVFQTIDTPAVFDFFYIIRKTNIIENGSYYYPGFVSIKKAEFTLILPDYLEAICAVYNGMKPVYDTLMETKEKRYSYTYAEKLPKISQDQDAFSDAHEARVEFAIAYNYSRSRMRVNSISDLSSNFYRAIAELEKEEKSLMKKIAAKIPIEKGMNEEQKIRCIEKYVKKDINYISINASHFSDLSNVLSLKYGNSIGLAKIYYYLFDYFNINNQFVLTSNKTYKTFDRRFDASNYLRESLFYFPNIKQYIAPDFTRYRLGLTPAVLTDHEGLFLKTIKVGKVTSFVPSFSKIPALPKEVTGDSLEVTLKLDVDKKNISGQVIRSLTGYNAVLFQANYNDYEDEFKEEIIDQYVALGSESINVNEVNVDNTSYEDVLLKPMVFNGQIVDYYITKFEDDKITVPIGVFIGKQSEFKQESERILPIERKNRSHYYRCIKIEIPEGYECKDYQNLNVEVYDAKEAQNAQCMFTAKVTKEGNYIIIRSDEYYNQLYYPVEDYTLYQKVINAAADFNRAELIFKKK